MASLSGVDFGVLVDARARQHRRRRRVIGVLFIAAALSALLGYGAGGGKGSRPRAAGPLTEALSRGVTLRLPAGRATEAFMISAPAERAYDVTLTAPAGSRIVVAMNIPAGGWMFATRKDPGCRPSAGRTICLLHFAAGGNPGGLWRAVVRKDSIPAAMVRISVVFSQCLGDYRTTDPCARSAAS